MAAYTRWTLGGAAALSLIRAPAPALAQSPTTPHVGAHAVLVGTHVSPGIAGRALTEGYLSQPVVVAELTAPAAHLFARATANLEGITLERGELSPGGYGEGYVDRRHPHSYVHELVVGVAGALGGTGVSVVAGRGFAPFGTDDPMMRPFVKYPVNHHLAQILERYLIAGAVRRPPLTFEVGVFNGDEPVGAGTPPNAGRFGDSWSARATLRASRPAAGALELSASHASVTSPEFRDGFGLDHQKWSASARFDGASGRTALRYFLVEWALTDELHGDRRAHRFTSALAEGAVTAGRAQVSLRYEQTTRPEEERLLDAFRTPRPPADLSLLGVTRWRIGTAGVSLPLRRGLLAAAPFLEAALLRPTATVTPSAFVPESFYGARTLWSVSAGARLVVGTVHARMGRYGVATPAPSTGGRVAPPHPH